MYYVPKAGALLRRNVIISFELYYSTFLGHSLATRRVSHISGLHIKHWKVFDINVTISVHLIKDALVILMRISCIFLASDKVK